MPLSQSLNAGLFTEAEQVELANNYQSGPTDEQLEVQLTEIQELLDKHRKLRKVYHEVNESETINMDVALEAYQTAPNALPYSPAHYTNHASKTHLEASLESMDAELRNQIVEGIKQTRALTRGTKDVLDLSSVHYPTFDKFQTVSDSLTRDGGDVSKEAAERFIGRMADTNDLAKSLLVDRVFGETILRQFHQSLDDIQVAQSILCPESPITGDSEATKLLNIDISSMPYEGLKRALGVLETLAQTLEQSHGSIAVDEFVEGFADARCEYYDNLHAVHIGMCRVTDMCDILNKEHQTIISLDEYYDEVIGLDVLVDQRTQIYIETMASYILSIRQIRVCAELLTKAIVQALEVFKE